MEDLYLEQLYDLIKLDEQLLDYGLLMEYLTETEFVWFVANDDNRARDGEALREKYGSYYRGPCTVLEMLIGLASRVEENIMGDPNDVDHTDFWFWAMINNLGLDRYDNRNFKYDSVDFIVKRWLERKYRADGTGGLFPLKYPVENQKDVEIWFQMCEWLNENYEIE